jgi:hypothetical protein
MNRENPLWGAPRIHGELLMLGIEVAESTVGRYMVRRRRPPSQGWKTFLRNHAAGIASLDLFVVRTISFKLLYGLVILRHAHRRLVTISVATNPTAEWIAGQVIDAFPWNEAPRQCRNLSKYEMCRARHDGWRPNQHVFLRVSIILTIQTAFGQTITGPTTTRRI